MKFKVTGTDPEVFISRMFYLAWRACRGPLGMGVLQDRGTNVPEHDVYTNIRVNGDYPVNWNEGTGVLSADYVFGRMMKMTVRRKDADCNDDPDGTIIMVQPDEPQHAYQAWATEYPHVSDLVAATAAS